MLEIDFTFPHSYEVEEVRDWPGTGVFSIPVIYFPPPKSRPELNGLWLRVRARNGASWIGVFAFRYNSPPAFSRVVSSPDAEKVCVVSKGAAYVVNAERPEEWEEIPISPVLDVRPLVEQKLLVFADFIRLAAYGRDKFAWRSPRVCWDELSITSVTSSTIEGTGFDPTNSLARSRFAVDLGTGRSLLPSPTGMPD